MAVGLVGSGNIENRDMLKVADPLLQHCKIFRAALQDGVKALELLAADRGIDVAQAVINTERKHVVNAGNGALGKGAIDAEGPRLRYLLSQIGVTREQHTAIARGDMLDRIERECPGIAE